MLKKTVLYLSDMCILDPNSGAAIEMHGWLNILQSNGYTCFSHTCSLFDGNDEFPIQSEIFPDIDLAHAEGKIVKTKLNGVEHKVFYAGTSIGASISAEMLRGFVASAAETIRSIKPDVVFGYGSAFLGPLRKLAKDLKAKTIFNLHNSSYDKSKENCFFEVDKVITPSHALKSFYDNKLNLKDISVVKNRVHRHVPRDCLTADYFEAKRNKKFVTLINPTISKGGTIFLQIANQFQNRFPDVTFLGVESRGRQEELESYVNGSKNITNIWWIQRQKNMRSLYERTSVLLVPSVSFEAAGRVIIEAQMAGIPVLGTDCGGIPETLNGGGNVFPIPKSIIENIGAVPSPEEVSDWVIYLEKLFFDKEFYAAACQKAIVAAESFAEKIVDKEIIDVIEFR